MHSHANSDIKHKHKKKKIARSIHRMRATAALARRVSDAARGRVPHARTRGVPQLLRQRRGNVYDGDVARACAH